MKTISGRILSHTPGHMDAAFGRELPRSPRKVDGSLAHVSPFYRAGHFLIAQCL